MDFPPDRATVRVARRFDFPAGRVFDAWLDPKAASRFLFATPGGEMVRAEIDARPGGVFCLTDRRGGEDIDHTGEYLEIGRPRRLVFTFLVPKYSSEKTRVTVGIEPEGDGACLLTLTHEGVLEDYAERTRGGWTMILEALEGILEGDD